MAGGATLSDVRASLENSTFRVGLHVTGYASGGSESYINNPVPITTGTPDPATGALLLTGAAGMIGRRRRVHG